MRKSVLVVIVAIIVMMGSVILDGAFATMDKETAESTYWWGDGSGDINVVVGAQEIGDEDFHNPECLVKAFRENPYSRLWCRETEQVAQMGRFGVEISTLTDNEWGEWKTTRIFPALGKRVPVGYFDRESSLTVAITADGVGLYRANGGLIAFEEMANDPAAEGMLLLVGDLGYLEDSSNMDCWAIVGDNVFAVDFRARTLARTNLDPWTLMFRGGSDSLFVTIGGSGYISIES